MRTANLSQGSINGIEDLGFGFFQGNECLLCAQFGSVQFVPPPDPAPQRNAPLNAGGLLARRIGVGSVAAWEMSVSIWVAVSKYFCSASASLDLRSAEPALASRTSSSEPFPARNRVSLSNTRLSASSVDSRKNRTC